MNSLRSFTFWLLAASLPGSAQTPAGAPTTPPLDTIALSPATAHPLTAEQLEQLLAPLALYPDALIALILPASTAPADLVLAARQVRETAGDRSQIEHRAWDESVKSLTHYPEVLQWLDDNLEWTKQVGEAFATQPVEVMQAIQRLRARARAAGALVDTPQHQVLTEAEVIRIVPAQPEIIYVPHYDPSLVFLPEPVWYGRPPVSFSFGLAVGSWLAFDCDWRRHTIWVGDRHRRWTGHDWRRPVVPIPTFGPGYARHPHVKPWRPTSPPARPPRTLPYRPSTEILRPGPIHAPIVRTSPSVPPSRRPPSPPGLERRPPLSRPPQSEPPAASRNAAQTFNSVKSGPVRPAIESPAPVTAPRRAPPENPRHPAYAPAKAPSSRASTAPPAAPLTSGIVASSPNPSPAQTRPAPPPSSRQILPSSRSYPRPTPPTDTTAGSGARYHPPPSSQTGQTGPANLPTAAPRYRPSTPPPTPPTTTASPPTPPAVRGEPGGERSIGRRPGNEQQR